jgi:FkbM family methyltransferase
VPDPAAPPGAPDDDGIRLGATMFLLPGDNRAQALRRASGVTQPRILALWTRLLEAFHPDLILDIGANHGEMSLPQRIPAPARLVMLEPNPLLAPLLARSVATHPDAARIDVRQAAVSDREGTTTLHLDEKWSGTSSLDFRSGDGRYKGSGRQTHRDVVVDVTTIDAIVAAAAPQVRCLAVKIDVEGHEARLLAGARQALAGPCFLILEFNARHLRSAGTQPEAFLQTLHALGHVLAIGRHGIGRVAPGAPIPAGADDLLVTTMDEVAAACAG